MARLQAKAIVTSSWVRYNSLTRSFPERAEELFEKAEKVAAEKYEHLEKLAGK